MGKFSGYAKSSGNHRESGKRMGGAQLSSSMISADAIRKLALGFEAAEEMPHFDKPSFRVRKKIFATLDLKNKRLCVKLSEINQSVFSAYDKTCIYPVPNKWGQQGWTFVELRSVRKEMLKDLLTQAYCEVAPAGLGEKYKAKEDE